MKFGISYNRKVKAGRTYEMLEIGLYMEFDTGETTINKAFQLVKSKVNKWIEIERDRILAECVPRPEAQK
jgi:hypothetical protein